MEETTTKGINPTTGTVHYARQQDGHLVQTCGMARSNRRRQGYYLFPVDDEPVTCKKCQAAH